MKTLNSVCLGVAVAVVIGFAFATPVLATAPGAQEHTLHIRRMAMPVLRSLPGMRHRR